MTRGAVNDLTIVVADRRTNTYGPNVVVGALETLPPPGRWEVRFAPLDALGAAIADAAEQSVRVLVAWSFYSADFARSTDLLHAVRAQVDPTNVTHVAGGVHASAEAARTLAAGWDLVAVGEGETTMTRLAAGLVEGAEPTSVPGLAWCDGEGRLATSGPAVREELDRFPAFAARHGRYNAIEITRGCVYACTFCQTPFLFKARFRHRSVDNVVGHVRQLQAAGRRDIRFVTPTSLSYGSQDTSVDLDAIGKLLADCRGAMSPTGRLFFGSFPSEVRPEHVSVEALRLLRRYVDNDNLVIGGQSGSDTVLSATNRGHSVAAVEEAVRCCVQEGFTPNVDFLFGLPSEDEDAARQSVEFAEHLANLGARIHSHTFMPLPGTPLQNAPAGRVSEQTAAALDGLAGRGRAYGQFRRQQRVAEEMVTFVGRRSRGSPRTVSFRGPTDAPRPGDAPRPAPD